MQAAGVAAFSKREEKRSAVYSFENEEKHLSPVFEEYFKANSNAWAFFQSQAPWYKRTSIYRVMTAKQEKTQLARLEALIKASAEGKRT